MQHQSEDVFLTILTSLTTILMSLCRQELSSRLSSSSQEMTINHLERQRSMVNIVTAITINFAEIIVNNSFHDPKVKLNVNRSESI